MNNGLNFLMNSEYQTPPSRPPLLLPQIKVNRYQRTDERRKKGDYFENLRFIQILFETQPILAPKKRHLRKKRHDKYLIFLRVSIDLEHVMFTIRTGNLFAILYTC